jgi:hypothetical protein
VQPAECDRLKQRLIRMQHRVSFSAVQFVVF